MLATLGLFVFDLQTAPFGERRRQTSWRWPQQSRVGARPALQFLGPGDDTIELTGVLMPEIGGGPSNLEALRLMASQGFAWPLIDAGGLVLGLYVVEDVSQTDAFIMDGGQAQRIEFSLSLRRADDYLTDAATAVAGAASAVGAVVSLF